MKKSLILMSFLLCFYTGFSQIRLPKLISNGMILQRDQPVRIWGWSSPDEPVHLNFDHGDYHTQANANGKWEIVLPARSAGGPYEMRLRASNEIVIRDILFGDIYICSGQSNMELAMERLADRYPDVIANAGHPAIRQFLVPDEYDFERPREDLSAGEWVSASPESVLHFSAVAYFFALDIQQRYKIPIGIINTALGGSPAQAWMSEAALRHFPAYEQEMQLFRDKEHVKAIEAADKQLSGDWYKRLNQKDEGQLYGWKRSGINDRDWQEMQIPGYVPAINFEQINGVVWFRKEIDLPAAMTLNPARLILGRLVDADSVFINGQFAGSTGYQYPPRRYLLPKGILKAGTNTITVRLVSNSGRAGFVPDKKYQLIAANDTINLEGSWKFKVGAKMEPSPPQTFVRWKAGGLFNAMIAPLQSYPVKGVLWYQGEANTGNPGEYFELMKALIADWRAGWHAQLPFLYVQLPGFMEAKKIPAESSWAELRAAQSHLGQIPGTAMAVAIDLGEWNDIHPLNKKDVGKRLALQAGHLIYGDRATVYSGPALKGIKTEGNKLVITFSNTGSGLMAKGSGKLQYFTIAGRDKKYVWANAEIKGDKVLVWSDEIDRPFSVRYAWSDNPEGANLYNKEGLPAAPFEVVNTLITP